MNLAYDIFIPSSYFLDMIYTDLPRLPTLGEELYTQGEFIVTGGGRATPVVTLKRLGVRVGWASRFGADFASQQIRALAQAEGIDLALAEDLDVPYRQVTTALVVGSERAFVSYVDPDPTPIFDHWLRCIDRCTFKHIHLCGLTNVDELSMFLERAKAHGATVSMECQDHRALYTAPDWEPWLSMPDVFMPNAREAMLITGASSVAQAIRQLSHWCKIVVVKDGANGAWVGQGTMITHVPAVDAGPVVDTTGAGDCFDAGFLYGWVIEHAPLEICTLYGNICGGLSVTAVGGPTRTPSTDELHQWADRLQGKR